MKKSLYFIVLLGLSILLVSCGSDLGVSDDGPYTITFESNGGSELSPMTVDEHDFFMPESAPTKNGYIFAGWFLDENFIYPMAFNAGTASSLTLYAKWVEETDLVTAEEIEAILSDLLDDLGYDMSQAELILAVEDALSDTLLTEEDVNIIVDSIINANDFVDEEALINQILASLDVVSLFENHITDMLYDVRESVVMVDTYDGAILVSGGSGVIYKREGNTYYVLTNEHVVYDYDNNYYYSNN
jgi:uncharacterized repeat protein (TIGR02543 family)